jgi:putative Mg2+ transporter-C (MgtC) family protein
MDNLWAVDAASLHLVVTIVAKLGIGALLASLIGWERERHGRPAGIRTHMLVVIGVILFTETGRGFAGADPSRVAAQVVTGIGFLGAGTILRNGLEIKGLTTAASIWAVAGIGMAISLGGAYMVVAVIATVMTLLTLTVVDNIERRIVPEGHQNELYLTLRDKADVAEVLAALGDAGLKINQTQILKLEPNLDLLLQVHGDKERVLAAACALPGVLNATWSG